MEIMDEKLPRERILRNLKLINLLAHMNDNGIDSVLRKKEPLDAVIFKKDNDCEMIDQEESDNLSN